MLYNKKTILSDLEITECLEVWMFSINVSYDEKNRSIKIVEKLGKEDGYFHFSKKRERIIHNEEYGKSFLLKPSYLKANDSHLMKVPLFVYPTPESVKETRGKLLSKMYDIIDKKTIEEEPNRNQILKRLKLFMQ